MLFSNVYSQSKHEIFGVYYEVDSVSKQYFDGKIWKKDIDTTLIQLNNNHTFLYKWSPKFGPFSKTHIYTTGTWKKRGRKILLQSKYQINEKRVSEHTDNSLEDSVFMVQIQTYDSFSTFFDQQYIKVLNNQSSSIGHFKSDSLKTICTALVKIKNADEVIVFGDFGKLEPIAIKNKLTNKLIIQFNWSVNWDYQYFKNYKLKYKKNTLVLDKKKLKKIKT